MPWDGHRPHHVPSKVRAAALERDGHQCRATLQSGGRCPTTTQLEAHETDQWKPGRTVTVDDVVMLCTFHHNLLTQQQAAQRLDHANQQTTQQSPGKIGRAHV